MSTEDTTQIKPIEQGRFDGTVRLIRESDLPQLHSVLETCVINMMTGQPLVDEINGDLQTMRESTTGRNNWTYFVAEEQNGAIVGVMGMVPPNERMHAFATTPRPTEIDDSYVSRDHRGRGIGHALLSALETEAKKRGHTELILNSGPRYRKTGWAFWDSLKDFSRIGIAKRYYDNLYDAPVWHKVLT